MSYPNDKNLHMDYDPNTMLREEKKRVSARLRDQVKNSPHANELLPIYDGISNVMDDCDNLYEWRDIKDSRDEKNQKALDDLLKKANAVPLGGGGYNTFGGQLKMA